MTNELTTIPSQEITPVSGGGITIEQAFQAAASKSLDKESLAVMKELLAMDAERRFNSAFVALQSEMPVIVAKTLIPNRGRYEKFEDLMAVLSPLLVRHGFSVSFSQPDEMPQGKIVETCCLAHAGGHARKHTCAVRTRKADNETQSDSMAMTTAKRNSLIQALNIVIRQDVLNEEYDAGIEGDPNEKITPEQAEELDRRVAMTNSDRIAFLKFAGAQSFTEIRANKYDELDANLRRKERAGK